MAVERGLRRTPLEQAVEKERKAHNDEESADANAGLRIASPANADEQHQAEADAHQRDARAAMARRPAVGDAGGAAATRS